MTLARFLIGLKAVAAVALIGASTLPAYSCGAYVAPAGDTVDAVPEGADPAQYRAIRIPHYALEGFHVRDAGSWITAFAFVWPLPVVGYRLVRRGGNASRVLHMLEPVFAVLAALLLYRLALLGRPEAGTWLAVAANVVLGLAAAAELVAGGRARTGGQPSAAPPSS